MTLQNAFSPASFSSQALTKSSFYELQPGEALAAQVMALELISERLQRSQDADTGSLASEANEVLTKLSMRLERGEVHCQPSVGDLKLQSRVLEAYNRSCSHEAKQLFTHSFARRSLGPTEMLLLAQEAARNGMAPTKWVVTEIVWELSLVRSLSDEGSAVLQAFSLPPSAWQRTTEWLETELTDLLASLGGADQL